MPDTWHFLPEAARDDIVLKALEDAPIFMRSFMTDMKDNIEDVLDIHDMVVSNLIKDKSLMNRVSARPALVIRPYRARFAFFYISLSLFLLFLICKS